ncbi:NO-inducible flavohemoprotein [Halobacillus litoralis]|uniref:NO-inducible flavohemoprotein n=1 Tax=Halobacillus litoralis TaxID=45668 RepID=UPI001CFDD7C8|nr:NO-inducible flavohemoprotein [Halobacillus litoralis]
MSVHVQHQLDDHTIQTIKSTVPVMAEHGEAITSHFYKQLFEDHPELRHLFNQTHQQSGEQPKALANAVYAAAEHIDQLSLILPTVRQIAEKHRSLNVQPEHYPIVGEYLLKAIKDVLGDAATDDIIKSWAKAYGVLAQVFIDVEEELYQDIRTKKGGWTGYRDFRVVDKVKETDGITSFYLEPEDGEPLLSFKPGQYITVKAVIPEQSYNHLRQYSLSDSPGNNHYRISVKRETGEGDHSGGVVSNWLHDSVNRGDIIPVSAPAGDFHLDDKTDRPLVLISGGGGVTPLMSMKKYAREKQQERSVYFIHAARNGNHHALKGEMVDDPSAFTHIIYVRPTEEDRRRVLFQKEGHIDLQWLQTIVPHDSEFYICGPEGFMESVYKALQDWNVPEEYIHYEFFGPKEKLQN